MKKKIIILIITLLNFNAVQALDYQYQYFNQKKKHVPFSDYIPRIRLHNKTVPHYLEDYYELYGMKQYYNENSLRNNIGRLKTALNSKFRHPSKAIVKIEDKNEYLKYRKLMFMHINLLIMRNYMKIASRYDKRKVYFYNRDFAKEIYNSLGIAENLYRQAIPYWIRAKNYATSASRIKLTTDLSFMESERFSIINSELDYKKIISTHLKRISKNKNSLSRHI